MAIMILRFVFWIYIFPFMLTSFVCLILRALCCNSCNLKWFLLYLKYMETLQMGFHDRVIDPFSQCTFWESFMELPTCSFICWKHTKILLYLDCWLFPTSCCLEYWYIYSLRFNYGLVKDILELSVLVFFTSFLWETTRYFNVIGSDPDGRLGEAPRPELREQGRISGACFDAARGIIPGIKVCWYWNFHLFLVRLKRNSL